MKLKVADIVVLIAGLIITVAIGFHNVKFLEGSLNATSLDLGLSLIAGIMWLGISVFLSVRGALNRENINKVFITLIIIAVVSLLLVYSVLGMVFILPFVALPITMFGGSMFVNPFYYVMVIYIIIYIVNIIVVKMKR